MAILTAASTPTPEQGSNRHRHEVPEGWRQGRGAFGGLVVATLMRAIEHRTGDVTRTVRSVTVELPGPVAPGPIEIEVEVLRHGTNMSTVRAALNQGGTTKSHAVAVLSTPRRGAGPIAWQDIEPPAVPSWHSVEPAQPGLGPDGAGTWPEFAQHFEYRVVEGFPMTGAAARTVGWIRPRHPGDVRDAAHIAALIDAWWPAALVRFTSMRPLATIVYTLDIVDGLAGLDPDAPLLYRATVPVCRDGYFLETRQLWGEDGRLVAINHQTFAII